MSSSYNNNDVFMEEMVKNNQTQEYMSPKVDSSNIVGDQLMLSFSVEINMSL